MPGFDLTLYGRFWVTPEGPGRFLTPANVRSQFSWLRRLAKSSPTAAEDIVNAW